MTRVRVRGLRDIFLFVFLLFVLSACARAPVENQVRPAWQMRKDELMRLEEWDARGRIAVRTDHESGSGSLYWTQRKDEYRVRVITPFGGGAYELTGGGDTALLRTPGNQPVRAGDAETLFQQHLGWRLPVSGLVHWIRGLPAPAWPAERLSFDEDNRLSALTQAGWSIRYKRYLRVNGKSMPGRLDLQNEHIRVRLSIREWNLP